MSKHPSTFHNLEVVVEGPDDKPTTYVVSKVTFWPAYPVDEYGPAERAELDLFTVWLKDDAARTPLTDGIILGRISRNLLEDFEQN